MTINKTQKIILLAAILIAASSTFFMLSQRKSASNERPSSAKEVSYKAFRTPQGWGYNVLIDGDTIIHQPFMPNEAGYKSFPTEQAANKDAQSVIEKIKSGEVPFFKPQ
jgi:hypothetical protein